MPASDPRLRLGATPAISLTAATPLPRPTAGTLTLAQSLQRGAEICPAALGIGLLAKSGGPPVLQALALLVRGEETPQAKELISAKADSLAESLGAAALGGLRGLAPARPDDPAPVPEEPIPDYGMVSRL